MTSFTFWLHVLLSPLRAPLAIRRSMNPCIPRCMQLCMFSLLTSCCTSDYCSANYCSFQTSMQQPCIANVTNTAPQVDDLVVYDSSVSCFPQWLEAVANSSVEQYTSPGIQHNIPV